MRDLRVKFCVPFCIKRCTYCARGIVEGWDSSRMHAYLSAMKRELEANAGQFSDCRVVAVRWGGGLASMANAQDIVDVMRVLRERFVVAEDAPVTMRAAIANVSGASMPFFRRAGVTRFDFEMMSLSPIGYAALNARDCLGDLPIVCDCFIHANETDLLGIVLVAGHAGAGRENFRRSVVEFTRMPAKHLIVQRCEGEEAVSYVETDAWIEEARPILAEAGFSEYAPLRFAAPGHEDRFTQLKLAGCDQLSFGLGARSRFEGAESVNTFDLITYCAHADDFSMITEDARPVRVDRSFGLHVE